MKLTIFYLLMGFLVGVNAGSSAYSAPVRGWLSWRGPQQTGVSLEKGLPDCCGVAVGVDRLMMLRQGASTIGDVIPFTWDEA